MLKSNYIYASVIFCAIALCIKAEVVIVCHSPDFGMDQFSEVLQDEAVVHTFDIVGESKTIEIKSDLGNLIEVVHHPTKGSYSNPEGDGVFSPENGRSVIQEAFLGRQIKITKLIFSGCEMSYSFNNAIKNFQEYLSPETDIYITNYMFIKPNNVAVQKFQDILPRVLMDIAFDRIKSSKKALIRLALKSLNEKEAFTVEPMLTEINSKDTNDVSSTSGKVSDDDLRIEFLKQLFIKQKREQEFAKLSVEAAGPLLMANRGNVRDTLIRVFNAIDAFDDFKCNAKDFTFYPERYGYENEELKMYHSYGGIVLNSCTFLKEDTHKAAAIAFRGTIGRHHTTTESKEERINEAAKVIQRKFRAMATRKKAMRKMATNTTELPLPAVAPTKAAVIDEFSLVSRILSLIDPRYQWNVQEFLDEEVNSEILPLLTKEDLQSLNIPQEQIKKFMEWASGL